MPRMCILGQHFSCSSHVISVSSDNDPAELGMDLLADVPCDEDLNCQSVLFESSEMLLVPAYKLKVHKEDM